MMMTTTVGLTLIGLLVCCCLAQTTEDQQDRRTQNSSQLEDADTNNTFCRQPMRVGPCRASMLRFFYDVTIQKCSKFTYGGCGANNNNFHSEEECNAACSGVSGSVLPDESTPALTFKRAQMVPAQSEHPQKNGMSADDFTDQCEAEPQSGPCKAAFQRWFYNKETGSCESFIYGGCLPNKNNYLSKESCIATCTVSVLQSSKKTSGDEEVSVDFSKHCLVTPDPGLCRAAFPMFYYDSESGSCRSFIYGGCGGNENRYGTVEECEHRCSQEGSFDGLGKSRHRWTAAFFLFATLAVISALLLVTLVIIVLRRRSLSRSVSYLSDKQELLPNEQLSVDSPTLTESPAPPHKA